MNIGERRWGVNQNDLNGPEFTKCGQYLGTPPDGAIVTVTCSHGIRGRYIYIQSPTTDRVLAVCEVEVAGGKLVFVPALPYYFQTTLNAVQGLHSLSGKSSYCQIYWSVEASKLDVKMNVTLLPRCLPNCRARPCGKASVRTVYPKKYAHGFCFAVLCCGYTLTDDCPSASKATLMNMDKYLMWIHYERLHNHNKAKHNKTMCKFLGIYCIWIEAQIPREPNNVNRTEAIPQ